LEKVILQENEMALKNLAMTNKIKVTARNEAVLILENEIASQNLTITNEK
jgi:hypothetical protein